MTVNHLEERNTKTYLLFWSSQSYEHKINTTVANK